MYYRAHISIKDMYAMKLNERIQNYMNTEMADREKEISDLSKLEIFGGPNREEVTQVFDFLMEEYKYQVVKEPLGKLDFRKIANSFKDSSSFWGKESPESLLKKEEGLALLCERLEQHLEQWVDHLETLEPELEDLKAKYDQEIIKVGCLTTHFSKVNTKQRDFLNLSNSLLREQQVLNSVMKDFHNHFIEFQKVTNPEL